MLTLQFSQQLGELNLTADLQIPTQGVTAILGRSGAGKSSLINVVAGLSTPISGKVQLNDKVLFDHKSKINLPPEKRQIGYVFQEPRLFPHYSVEKNLKYGCKRSNSEHFLQIVQLLGIGHLLARLPASLSGGEKQRVAIGRALLSEPDILLMDEPLSALDLPRKQELLHYLSQLAKQINIPILYVTHSLDEIIRLANRMVLLEKGKVVAFDSVKNVWQNPHFAEWQNEQSRLSLLELPISQHQAEYQMLGLAIGSQQLWINEIARYQLGDNVRITINSKDVSISLSVCEATSIRNCLQGKIIKIEPKSQQVDLLIDIEGEQIWATISHWAFEELNLQLNQSVFVQIKSVSI